MKKISIWLLCLVVAALIGIYIFAPKVTESRMQKSETSTSSIVVATSTQEVSPMLTHQQEVWLYALEWCESSGVKTAVNVVDRDGTSSYYSFQFKPGTFKYYGVKYAVLKKGITESELWELLKSYELQRLIVSHMILDPGVNWRQQFPDCVRKNGLPPKQ